MRDKLAYLLLLQSIDKVIAELDGARAYAEELYRGETAEERERAEELLKTYMPYGGYVRTDK